jgi:hypothetical protein
VRQRAFPGHQGDTTGHKDAAGSGANRVYSPGRSC